MSYEPKRFFILKNIEEKYKSYIQKIIDVSDELEVDYFQEKLLDKLIDSYCCLRLIIDNNNECFSSNNFKLEKEILSFINEMKKIIYFVDIFEKEQSFKQFKSSIHEDIRYVIFEAERALNYNGKDDSIE